MGVPEYDEDRRKEQKKIQYFETMDLMEEEEYLLSTETKLSSEEGIMLTGVRMTLKKGISDEEYLMCRDDEDDENGLEEDPPHSGLRTVLRMTLGSVIPDAEGIAFSDYDNQMDYCDTLSADCAAMYVSLTDYQEDNEDGQYILKEHVARNMKLTDRKAEQYAFLLIGDIETKELSTLKNFLIILENVGIDAVPTNAERDVITAVIVGMPDEVRKIEVFKKLGWSCEPIIEDEEEDAKYMHPGAYCLYKLLRKS
jgi:hypothetical protein